MSAECAECGFDLVGSQYDERGLWCVPCDLERKLAEAEELLKEVVNAKPARLKAVMFAIEVYLRVSTAGEGNGS